MSRPARKASAATQPKVSERVTNTRLQIFHQILGCAPNGSPIDAMGKAIEAADLALAPSAEPVSARIDCIVFRPIPSPRFTKVSAAGALLPNNSAEWEGVYDATTGLIWGRKLLPGTHEWKDAVKLAAATTLCGAAARAPTIQERLSIVDYGRTEPALDTTYFDSSEKNAWEWTSTPAQSPSVYAWGVYLGDGGSYRLYQGCDGCVRAVRAGQF